VYHSSRYIPSCPEEEERYFPYAAQNTVVFPNPDGFTSWMTPAPSGFDKKL
jgi:hypothetical protein